MNKIKKCQTLTYEFRAQMVQLYNAGKFNVDIIRKYDIFPTAFDKRVKCINASKETWK